MDQKYVTAMSGWKGKYTPMKLPLRNKIIPLLTLGILCLFTLTSCGMPEQDCGFVHVNVRGMIVDSSSRAIANAKLVIRGSTKAKNLCSNASAIEEVVIFTNKSGEFTYTFPQVSEGQALEIIVTADGYNTYSNAAISTDYQQKLKIVLSEVN